MTTSGWRKASRDRIYEVLLEQEAQAALLGDPLDAKTVLKAISNAYPFHGRSHHPYKQWLAEFKIAKEFIKAGLQSREWYAFCERYERAARGYRQTGGRIPKPVEGQMSLL